MQLYKQLYQSFHDNSLSLLIWGTDRTPDYEETAVYVLFGTMQAMFDNLV